MITIEALSLTLFKVGFILVLFLRYYCDECQAKSFGSYYILKWFQFSSPSLNH